MHCAFLSSTNLTSALTGKRYWYWYWYDVGLSVFRFAFQLICLTAVFGLIYGVSQKNPPWNVLTFFPNGWEFLVQILHDYYTFPSTLDKKLVNYLQLWRSYAILSAPTIMYSKCTPSTETHAGWSHLIWHNFTVIVGDNWIKTCILACVWTFNRCGKFGLKIPNCLGKMSENASVRFSRWWTSCAWCELGGHA